VDVRSNWNDIIKNVYAELVIRQGDKVIDTIKTSSVDLEAWQTAKLIGFWEKAALDPGDYDIDVYIYYYDKYTKQQLKVQLQEKQEEKPSPSQENNTLMLVAVIILALILMINIARFFIKPKQKKPVKKTRKR
jgi:hypothetical protein